MFKVENQPYAYDLNTQTLLSIDPALAEVLRDPTSGSAAARAVLKEAQDKEGLFLPHRPRLVPHQPAAGARPDEDLQHLVLTVTDACNLRCAYCLHGADLEWTRSHGTTLMSVETAVAAVKYFLDRRDPDRQPVISFYGGEALLNLPVLEAVVAVAQAHQRGGDVTFALDTNGVLLTGGATDLVVQAGMQVQISIDGPAAVHDKHRVDASGRPTFSQIMQNIGRLLDRDPAAAERLSFIMTLAPPVDLLGVAGLFESFPPFIERGITTQPIVTVNFANLKGQDWAPDQEQEAGLPLVTDQVEQAREIYLEAFAAGELDGLSPVIRALFDPDVIRFHHRSRAGLGETYTPGGNCRPGKRKLHVRPDGVLDPCERTGGVMSIGDLENGIAPASVEGLDAEFFAAVNENCNSCWALRMCSVCFAVQAEAGGQVPESVCNGVRESKERVLKMMVRIMEMPPATREWLKDTEIS